MASEKNLLIIEDDEDLLALVKKSLEDVFENVYVISDPDQAVDSIKKYNPALIICDVQLPGRSGIELLQQLRAMGFVTPVVFMTGNDDTNTILAAMRLGAVDYLIKPISMKDVRRVLERIKFAEDKKAKVQELRAEHAAESEIAKQEKMLGLLQATSVEKNKKTGTDE